MQENEDAEIGWVVFGTALILISGFVSFCALPHPPVEFNSAVAGQATPTPYPFLTGGG